MAYWDRISSTKVAKEARDKMVSLLDSQIGNAQSPQRLGSHAAKVLEESRIAIAELIGSRSDEIIFTSNGTESNNLALQGMVRSAARKRQGRKIIVSAIEHVSIMKTVQQLEKENFEVRVIPVDSNGLINREAYMSALDQNVVLVSIQLANPEVGTIQPIADLSAPARKLGAVFHTDAVAAAGWIPINVDELGVDALSLSGTVFHGPHGGAALYLRKGAGLTPITFGGIQERNRRPGLENILAIAGLGEAAKLAKAELGERMEHASQLALQMREGLGPIEALEFTGHPEHRLPGHVSVIVKCVEGEALLLMLDMKGICAASGSSCTAKDLKISPVLMAMGMDHTSAQGSLVFSSSRDSAASDVEEVVAAMPAIIDRLRQMSPLWHQRKP